MSWFRSLFSEKKNKRIFLDYASATPILPEVRQAVAKYFLADFYNPSAIYEEGVKVRKEVEECRAQVAKLLGASAKEIIFTSGGTESDNLAILGAFEAFRQAQGKRPESSKPHIIISAIEHPAVMRAAEEVVRRGGEMSIAEVDEEGVVSFEHLKNLLKKNTFLVSIGLANSEIGTIQPLAKIGRLIKEERKSRESNYPLFHTDASAGASFINVNIETLQCDLMTLDGAKIYGPKGIGALALRRGVSIHPIIFGGGQERGRRAGTENPGLIAGFARALEIAARDREKEGERLESMRQEFINIVVKNLPQAIVNGSGESHLPNIVSVSIPGVLAEFLLLKLDKEGVLVSAGTACSLDEKESGSPVIRALGKNDLAESTLRLSFGRFTTEKEMKKAAEIFCNSVGNMLKSPSRISANRIE
jgi:cysteine desulfurase